jgi:hypothetical protein
MQDLTPDVRRIARGLLENKQVDRVLGWARATETGLSTPVWIDRSEDAERLVFDEYCIHNLSTLLLDWRDRPERIGIFAKGCDSRGIVRLLEDEQFSRQRLHIIGIACPGMKDPLAEARLSSGMWVGARPVDGDGDGKADDGRSVSGLADKCLQCTHPNPVLYDELLGEPQPPHLAGERFADVLRIEALDAGERHQFFEELFSKCIRCYACRNACVACNCRQCIFDGTRP